jgi:hypothetical protein
MAEETKPRRFQDAWKQQEGGAHVPGEDSDYRPERRVHLTFALRNLHHGMDGFGDEPG